MIFKGFGALLVAEFGMVLRLHFLLLVALGGCACAARSQRASAPRRHTARQMGHALPSGVPTWLAALPLSPLLRCPLWQTPPRWPPTTATSSTSGAGRTAPCSRRCVQSAPLFASASLALQPGSSGCGQRAAAAPLGSPRALGPQCAHAHQGRPPVYVVERAAPDTLPAPSHANVFCCRSTWGPTASSRWRCACAACLRSWGLAAAALSGSVWHRAAALVGKHGPAGAAAPGPAALARLPPSLPFHATQTALRPAPPRPPQVRFLHNPWQPHGFVGAALSSNVIHFTKVGPRVWRERDGGREREREGGSSVMAAAVAVGCSCVAQGKAASVSGTP